MIYELSLSSMKRDIWQLYIICYSCFFRYLYIVNGAFIPTPYYVVLRYIDT